MPPSPLPTGNLRRIFVLRWIEIGVLLLVLLFAWRVLALPIPLLPVSAAIAAMFGVNLLTAWRLHQTAAVSDPEFFAQLLADVAAITAILYYSGGSTNPLVSFYLIPLVIAAITLPAAWTWGMAVLTAGCYTLLMFRFYPLMPSDGDLDTAVYLHLTGMWLTFVLSAFVIAFFVVRMREAIRERDRQIAAAREDTLRNERIVALGTLAAGAAHELGTPLATMAVLTHELQQDYAAQPELAEDLKILREQVDVCKGILSGILASAGQARGEDAQRIRLDQFLDALLERWYLMRPQVLASVKWHSAGIAPLIAADQTLMQALLNLLNNAADASPHSVEVEGSWQDEHLQISILDRGPGLSPEVIQRAGEAFFTTKKQGFGIGLFLANATIERFGGQVSLRNREGGGAVTDISIPLHPLLIEPT
ncbi:MAG: ATP-binding protein [Sulfuricellaceae bacterium]|nr:ATP-binding protein [Sulfuricellaceae bacterium]